MEFKEIVKSRYAVKKFTGEKIPESKINELLEIIRMAPSSFGLQPWKIKIIQDEETKQKLFPASYNQEQIITCSHLFVFCANTSLKQNIDLYEEMMKLKGIDAGKAKAHTDSMRESLLYLTHEQKLSWAQRQMYIALSNAVNGAKSLGFDSCPMEGFNPEEYKKILNLPEYLHPTALVTIGFAADKPREKIRYSKEEMFF